MFFSRRFANRSNRRGVATVEFALFATIFVAFLMGIIEFGRMLMVDEILVNAAREGVRQSIVAGETDAQVTTAVSNYLSAAAITGYTATLSPTEASSPAAGATMTMTISVPCTSVSWFSNTSWFSGKTLTATVSMVKE